MLLWAWRCRYLFEFVFFISSDICLGVELWDHTATLFLIFLWNLHTVFQFSWPHQFSFPPTLYLVPFSVCCAQSLQSCATLCDPTDCSPLGSSVHRILQARIVEWVAISYSKGSSRPRDQTCVSCIAGAIFTTEPPGKPFSLLEHVIWFKCWVRPSLFKPLVLGFGLVWSQRVYTRVCVQGKGSLPHTAPYAILALR